MASVGYCFNVCRAIDTKITNERRSSMCNPTLPDIPTNTGALIFGRRFSFNNIILPTVSSSSQKQNDLSSDEKDKKS
jgi:hypothetical protein